MGIILDTGILIAYERGNLDIDKLVKDNADEPFGLSAITVSELLHGVHRADSESRKLKREAFVQKVIDTFPIYPFDISAARIYADVWASLLKRRSHRRPRPANSRNGHIAWVFCGDP